MLLPSLCTAFVLQEGRERCFSKHSTVHPALLPGMAAVCPEAVFPMAISPFSIDPVARPVHRRIPIQPFGEDPGTAYMRATFPHPFPSHGVHPIQLTHPQPSMTATPVGYYRPFSFTHLLTYVMSISQQLIHINNVQETERIRPFKRVVTRVLSWVQKRAVILGNWLSLSKLRLYMRLDQPASVLYAAGAIVCTSKALALTVIEVSETAIPRPAEWLRAI